MDPAYAKKAGAGNKPLINWPEDTSAQMQNAADDDDLYD